MQDTYNVEVEYRKPIKGGHMLKVVFHDYGMFIDGWTLRNATSSPSRWWFQPPFRVYNGNYIKMVEFANGEFKDWLTAEAIRVVEVQSSSETAPSSRKGLDTVYDVPNEMYGDEATRNKYLNDSIDQTLLDTGIEPENPKRRYHE